MKEQPLSNKTFTWVKTKGVNVNALTHAINPNIWTR